jgi:hypothetical protein
MRSASVRCFAVRGHRIQSAADASSSHRQRRSGWIAICGRRLRRNEAPVENARLSRPCRWRSLALAGVTPTSRSATEPSVPIESEQGSTSCFDAFSSREPVSNPHQVRGSLSLENALVCQWHPDARDSPADGYDRPSDRPHARKSDFQFIISMRITHEIAPESPEISLSARQTLNVCP